MAWGSGNALGLLLFSLLLFSLFFRPLAKGHLIGLLVGLLAGLLVGLLACWLVCCLACWRVGLFDIKHIKMY